MKYKKILFLTIASVTLLPGISSALGLTLGIVFALALQNPFSLETKRWTPRLLQLSVIGLGAQMDLLIVAKVGIQGVGYTVTGISLTLLLGWLIGKALKNESESTILISVGTAICGGSAIAAVAPTINARSESVTVSLATVFLLNSVALLLFPPLGHFFHLSENQFGLWSALAIHDTSSVVGASAQFGKEALQTATTIKLARALWIVPLTFLIGRWFGNKKGAKKPWFILGFIAAAAAVTYFPELRPMGDQVAWIARRTLVLTLFLIGSSLSKKAVQEVGFKPMVLGVSLWIIASSATLWWLHSATFF